MQERKQRNKIPPRDIEVGLIPPQATDLEQAVLGAVMLERDAITKIIHIAQPEIFYKESHQKIFQAVLDLYDKNNPIDILTVTQQCKKNGTLEIAGGPFYITELTSRVASSSNIIYHCMIVFQKHIQREIIRICSEAVYESFKDTSDLFDTYEKLVDDIKRLGIDKASPKEQIVDSVDDVFESMEENNELTHVSFYKTKLQSLNEMVSPSPGNVLLISGWSGSGKSSLISEMIFGLHELNPDDISTLWYTMEDPPKHVILGYISRYIKLSVKQMLGIGYKMKPEEINEAKSYQNRLKSFDIEFVGRRTKIKTIKNHFIQFVEKRQDANKGKKSKMYILIIDNLMKLLDYNEERGAGTNTTIDDYVASVIGDIFDATKDVCFIIMLHHLTKDLIKKEMVTDAFKPTMGHIRGSARLHEICTQVILLNRPFVFDDLMKEYKGTEMYDSLSKLILLEITKNRFLGVTGIIRLLADLNTKTFKDLNYQTNQNN